MFDRYVSLGCNCEPAFQVMRVTGSMPSGFFTWNVTPLDALVSLLRSDFADILEPENLSPIYGGVLLSDASHGFQVHSSFDPDYDSDPDRLGKIGELKAKFLFLSQRFKERARAETTAFLCKAIEPDPHARLCKVASLLADLTAGSPFRLIVVREAGQHAEPALLDGPIVYRTVRRFAPDHDAHDAHVSSWDKIFREFPLNSPMSLSGY